MPFSCWLSLPLFQQLSTCFYAAYDIGRSVFQGIVSNELGLEACSGMSWFSAAYPGLSG